MAELTAERTAAILPEERSPGWSWWICAVLFLALFLNYGNRAAFTQNARQIQQAFATDDAGYGQAEGAFNFGFAWGGLLFGILADKFSVRWLYPVVVIVWSLAGMSRGVVDSLFGLAVSQAILGLFEAGHWPCALRTTQRVFKPAQRTMGNSILQSGASVGSVVLPLAMVALHKWDPAQWKLIFSVIGGLGLPWAALWLVSIRESDLQRPVIQTPDESTAAEPTASSEQELQELPFWKLFTTIRWWLLLLTVICINTVWHYIRVWTPLTLEIERGYSHEFVQYFTSGYYAVTFFGSLASGWFTMQLAQRGWNVHRARMHVFLGCSVLSMLTVPAAFLPNGPLLLGTMLLIAFGSLGLFPLYYSLNQELSAKNQGKVGGIFSFCSWILLSQLNPAIGRLVNADPSLRPYIFAAVGLGPIVAFAALALFWGKRPVLDTEPA